MAWPGVWERERVKQPLALQHDLNRHGLNRLSVRAWALEGLPGSGNPSALLDDGIAVFDGGRGPFEPLGEGRTRVGNVPFIARRVVLAGASELRVLRESLPVVGSVNSRKARRVSGRSGLFGKLGLIAPDRSGDSQCRLEHSFNKKTSLLWPRRISTIEEKPLGGSSTLNDICSLALALASFLSWSLALRSSAIFW